MEAVGNVRAVLLVWGMQTLCYSVEDVGEGFTLMQNNVSK